MSGQHLVNHDGKAVDVAALVDRLRHGLLGGDVAQCAEQDAGCGSKVVDLPAREPEVDDLRDAVDTEHEISRRQIAVHEPEQLAIGAGGGVGVRQPIQRGDRDRQGDLIREHPLLLPQPVHRAFEIHADDVFHRHAEGAVLVAGIDDARDVLVAQVRCDVGFAVESRLRRVVAFELRQQALEDANLFRPILLGDEHLGHAPGRQVLEDAVATDALIPGGNGFKGHERAVRSRSLTRRRHLAVGVR